MKRLQLLLLTLLSAASLWASPHFEAGQRYQIVCQQFTQGCVVDGATLGRNTPLFYQNSSTQSDESYWIFTSDDMLTFNIQNAKTGQYVTYDGVRQDSPELRRYVCMTDELDGEKSQWLIVQMDNGNYVIRNLYQNDHIWDVRVDSYCVGTYSNNGWGNQNQQFYFLDEEGNRVRESQPNDLGYAFEVSSWVDATTESPDGWSFEGSVWTDPGFGDYYNGDAYVVSPFLERWVGQGALSNCKIYQQLANLPAGSYTLMADIISVRQSSGGGWWGGQQEQVGRGVYLFANDSRTEAGTNNEKPQTFSVDATLDAMGGIKLGISVERTNANWVACDNFRLLFKGTEDELIAGEKAKVRVELSDFFSPGEIDAMITQAGDNFYALEELRKSTSSMASIDPLARALKGLTIDERSLVWVESLNLYLCTLPLEHFEQEYTATIAYEPRSGFGHLSIDGTTVEPGSSYRFKTVRGERTYQFRVIGDDGSVVEKEITFTSLPVVKLYGSFSNNYSEGSIIVHEPDKVAPEMLHMKAKWRGGITNSNGKHKRNYHVKLLDENGEKLEKKFFGLRNDNSWILESCQVDMSRIRNRVLTDLWNDYCTPPYYIRQESKALSGSRGHFVELILNDEYRGIYCMTENMDRKQMRLAKYDETDNTIHGQLWKSKDWSFATLMGTRPDGGYYPKDFLSDPNEYSDMWDSYQTKYPDLEDVMPADWSTLYNAVDFVCYASDDDFKRYFIEYFDLPVVIDYYILMETILSTDNHGKNMYFAVYDKQKSKKITLGVWDMDATCGQRWSDDYYHQSFLGPEQDYARFIANYEHGDYNLFKRLRDTNAEDFNMKVRTRYRDLREGYLATESILDRFRTYLDEFKMCGAAQREYDKWSYDSDVAGRRLDFDEEMAYLDDWFTRRMNYLDTKRFDIASLPNAVTSIDAYPGGGLQDVVYDLKGQRVGSLDGFDQLPAGVYICNGKKIVRK